MSTAFAVNAGIRLMAAWKVARLAAWYSAWNAGVVAQPAAQRGLPHADAGRGLHDGRLGQERQDGSLAHGAVSRRGRRGFSAHLRSSALVWAGSAVSVVSQAIRGVAFGGSVSQSSLRKTLRDYSGRITN